MSEVSLYSRTAHATSRASETATPSQQLGLQGYLAHKTPPRRTLGIFLLQGPRRGVFLVSEVPLYGGTSLIRPPPP